MSVGAYDQVPFTELLREPSVTAGRLRDTRRLRLRRMLPQALSWVTFLPTKAVDELVEELVAHAAGGGVDRQPVASLATAG
ncbi:MAG: hypothetical protein ACRDUV_19685 [Pseudonocardiaceae bacterium]